jgi:nitrogen fixation/metabolism regulation signal transduction histidine kinase
MKYIRYFILQICAVIALAAAIIFSAPWYLILLAVLFCVLTFILAYQSVAVPLRTVQNGLYLLQEQDFTSRLRFVGQADADKVVKLFNDLMSSMKAERLKNIEQNDFLHKLIDASPMGIAICDFDGKIKESNPAFKALASDDLFSVLTSLDDGQSRVFRFAQAQILRCSRHHFMEAGFKRPFFLVERLTDEIIKAETAIFSKIVRTMGHEVNNTLGSVTSVLESLSDMHSEDQFVSDTLRSSIDSCSRLGNFVKGYSDVVKLPDPELEWTELNNLIADIFPTLNHLVPENTKVTVVNSAEPTYANIDITLFERVLVNIVKNAVESIGDKDGEIKIAISNKSVCVTDNGRGIDDNNAKKLFTPFFSTKHQDRGLGLMLIAEILRKHHADFALSTDHSTHLTTFHITFP